jgi:hypothetical protein
VASVRAVPTAEALRSVLREGVATYRAHWKRIVGVSALVLIPAAALGTLADGLLEKAFGDGDLAVTILAVSGIGVASLGYYLLKGVLAHVVVSRHRGDEPLGLAEVAPRLPYVPMILTDLILAIGVGVGTELLIVPGLLFGAYFGLAPVVAELEKRDTFGSLKRSRELVSGNFWAVATIMSVTLVGVALLSLPLKELAAVIFPGGKSDPLEEGMGLLFAGILIKPIGAVASIELTLDLIATGPSAAGRSSGHR